MLCNALETHLKDDLFVRTGSKMLAHAFCRADLSSILKMRFLYSKNLQSKIKNLIQANYKALKIART